MNNTDRHGIRLIRGGLLLIAAAFLLTGYNFFTAAKAARSAETAVEQLFPVIDAQQVTIAENELTGTPPDYILDPEMDMPTGVIDGRDYIGVLQIPALGLDLPVLADWSYPALKIAPCRYTGTIYQHNMVICAHNYARHFGALKTLLPGTEVIFADMDGNVFRYQVAELETLQPTAIEDMKTGDWDLSLFTCTIGGATRVTVRCDLVE